MPRSLFDKPKEVVMKQRRDAKMQRLSQNLQVGTEAHKFKPWRVGGKGDYLKTELVVDD